ncbi:MAG: four-helix bundle copper-binding protein [Candidatus Margulisiibacteriota bacterium]|nr:MAG: hypothetical protein A2X43_05305 [Candidatus Margulisbacteria bacterium GWD2_39_127]OGI01479.1 MAG: hypothetical protein A2X42_11910 [Candidatus Margulisbacteria bacterium GWF2_38_17]OGI10822.1 MAG: hypothetical protein A2X41_10135 [Candidatus Margulisbacteria bacterium GWE2_39_32]PZM83960.1 MAG: four-helix bundle copper-binding protein [Candidatus Margulisiibacteriota bacterium]HAR64458.1 ferredoxin [Candidatus Margulisiibacteriota bacterium]
MAKILELSDQIRECIGITKDCANTCTETQTYCLQLGGNHAELNHMRMLLDCTEMCNTCSDVMMRGSDYYQSICYTCAEICEWTAASCDQFEDMKMGMCADTCRQCANVCRQMSGKMGERSAA